MNGQKTIRFTKPLPCGKDATNKLGAQYRATDLIITVVTLTMAELVKTDSMRFCVPFTLRGFPDKISELQVNNDFAAVPFWLRFPKDL